MTAHSLQRTGLISKIAEHWKTHFPRTSASLRDEQFNQGNQSNHSSKQTQALRRLRQIYHLERRCFL